MFEKICVLLTLGKWLLPDLWTDKRGGFQRCIAWRFVTDRYLDNWGKRTLCTDKIAIVWILGNSWLMRLQKFAREQRVCQDMEIADYRLIWERNGLHWHRVSPTSDLWGCDLLYVVVIHWGGNDLGLILSVHLIQCMKADLDLWSGAVIVFTDLAERLNSCYSDNIKAINKHWKNINWEIRGFMADQITWTVLHRNITSSDLLHAFSEIGYVHWMWSEDFSLKCKTVGIFQQKSCVFISLAGPATNSTLQPF